MQVYWFFYGHVLSEQWGLQGLGSKILGIVLKLLLLLLYLPFPSA
jgi:hypothetical protein